MALPLLTVAEILRSLQAELDPGAALLAGEAGLGGEVSWSVTARPTSPMFPSLRAGELAIAAAPMLKSLDPPASLREFITGLEERGASGLLLRGPIDSRESARAAARAEELVFPLIQLSDTIHLSDVERAIIALISDRRDELYRRTSQFQELQFQFVDRSNDGRSRSLDALARAVSRMVNAPVLIAGPDMETRSRAGTGNEAAGLPHLWAQVAPQAALAWRAPGVLDGMSPAEPAVLDLALEGDRHILAAPLLVRDRLLGALVLLPPDSGTMLDRITLARAAGVGALEMARDNAVAAAETRTQERMRGEFVSELLNHNGNGGEEALVARARALGIELAQGYAVAVVGAGTQRGNMRAGTQTPNQQLERDVEATVRTMMGRVREPRAMFHTIGDRLLLVWPTDGRPATPGTPQPDTPGRLAELAEEARRDLEARSGSAAAGVGRGHKGLGGAAKSREEAEQALWSAWHLFGGGRVSNYAEVGVYRLLLLLRQQHISELRSFYYETMGELAGDDRASKADQNSATRLVETLESYLAHGGNVTATADALSLHRNTLNYRLRRIEEITGLDLDDPATRFRVQVALAVRRLL